jgi:RNA polymerase sigma factor (TIGR02999 family)
MTDGEVTRLLADLRAGNKEAEEALFFLVYDELHALAHRFMRYERPGHTLQTTALVHEAYLRLGGARDEPWENRAHFLRLAAKAMRRILIDYARRKKSNKQGGKRQRESLEKTAVFEGMSAIDLLALNDALDKLSEINPRTEELVELRFFGGLPIEDIARILKVTTRTIKYDWRMAKAWLSQQLRE